MVQAGGVNMNTWVVGNAPVGHYGYEFQEPIANTENGLEEIGRKVFFMKARIFAGQADLTDNLLDLLDFRWLAKEEMQELMKPGDFSNVRNMLAER